MIQQTTNQLGLAFYEQSWVYKGANILVGFQSERYQIFCR